MRDTLTEEDAQRRPPLLRPKPSAILAASLGTSFEYYDFFLYGSLATIIASQFFAPFPEGTRNIFVLLAFAVGFLVRPLGALVFGRLGDMLGRKSTFLATIVVMGASTILVGIVPNYAMIGWRAPVLLVALRIVQGLALGGEFGGAATYVAESTPRHRRGFYTSWIQTTASFGLLLSLLAVASVRLVMGNAAFADWGWRIPFVGSAILLAISVWIRIRMEESPTFQRMKQRGRLSKAPVREVFFEWRNLRLVLIALFGIVAGQAVIGYTGQYYVLFFLETVLKLDFTTANTLVAWALLLSVGGFVLCGWLSDIVGRKPIIIAGCVLAALTIIPLYQTLTRVANPALAEAHRHVRVVLHASGCSFQFNPVGTAHFDEACDVAKQALNARSVIYETIPARAGESPWVAVGDAAHIEVLQKDFRAQLDTALTQVGYPLTDDARKVRTANFFDIFRVQPLEVLGVLMIIGFYVSMTFGPVAAALVELFPTRIRYTAMSFPFHVGTGWFGGLLPAVATALVLQKGDIYYGLWYPVIVSALTAVIALIFLPERSGRDFLDESDTDVATRTQAIDAGSAQGPAGM